MSTKSEPMVLLKSTRLVHIVICDEFRPIVVNVRSLSVCDDMTTIEVDKFSMLLFLAIDISLHPILNYNSCRIVYLLIA